MTSKETKSKKSWTNVYTVSKKTGSLRFSGSSKVL